MSTANRATRKQSAHGEVTDSHGHPLHAFGYIEATAYLDRLEQRLVRLSNEALTGWLCDRLREELAALKRLRNKL
jgi:hypothetical protein